GLILADRRPVGEMQPKFRNGKPAGEPIPGYLPAVVSEEEWQEARLAVGSRKPAAGRVGEHVNIFCGLLKNAREHDTYFIGSRTSGGKHRRVLLAKKAVENGSGVYGFDFDIFERAVLSKLQEIKPAEILGDQPGQNDIIKLSIELENVRTQQDAITAELMIQ